MALYPREALVNRIVSSERPLCFLVGAPLTAPEHADKPGVPGVTGIIERVREAVSRQKLDVDAFDRSLLTHDDTSRYQHAMAFMYANFGPDHVKRVIQSAVRMARLQRPEDRDRAPADLERDVDGWHLNSGVCALAQLMVDRVTNTRKTQNVLTVNFDPLLEVAVKRAGMTPTSEVLPIDGSLDEAGFAGEPTVRIVHLHGYWRGDTLHVPDQLTLPRPRLQHTLASILKENLLVTVAYGGWRDVFTDALANTVLNSEANVDVLWACYTNDDVRARDDLRDLLESVSDAVGRGRFQLYGGVDCHWLFPELQKSLQAHGGTPAEPAVPETPTTVSRPAEKPANTQFERAVRIIGRHGDTDIFPFPTENLLFSDQAEGLVELLGQIDEDFDQALKAHPVHFEKGFTTAGYYGFRWGTQIDPVWNAYQLALVIGMADEIESKRIPAGQNRVFSYRYQSDPASDDLFRRDFGWTAFHQHSIKAAADDAVTHVVSCDISDFYQRVRHEELENELCQLNIGDVAIKRIMALLYRLSSRLSYGLPVGGDASRLLSELVLNRIDRAMLTNSVEFCRFVDDYHIFASSETQAFEHLFMLSEKLLEHGGLSLQRSKTRIMSASEFISTSEFRVEAEADDDAQRKRVLTLRIPFDPYGADRLEDYEALKEEVRKFDIIGMLSKELSKTRVDKAFTEKLIRTMTALDGVRKQQAADILLDNIESLYPVFPILAIRLKSVVDDVASATRQQIFGKLRDLIDQQSYLLRVPIHLAFAIRVLAHDSSQETETLLVKTYQKASSSQLVRRDIILAMGRRGSYDWINGLMSSFERSRVWERRALLIASHAAGKGGQRWREKVTPQLSRFERLIVDWVDRQPDDWKIPL